MQQELRLYTFSNMYMSSIQQGIQSAHAVAEMFTKYPHEGNEIDAYLWKWAKQHKTMILLNAGYSSEIRTLVEFFVDTNNPYPWAPFFESEEALDGALTTVGIILPEKIFVGAAQIRGGTTDEQDACREKFIEWSKTNDAGTFDDTSCTLTDWELDMMLKLNKYGLAK
jgi:hypothetical protein